MQKQKQRGRATLVGRPSTEDLLCHLFADLQRAGLTDDERHYCLSLPLPDLAAYAGEKASAARSTAGAVQEYILWSQIEAFVKKNASVKSKDFNARARKESACKAFLAGERACRRSNRRLAWYRTRQSRHHMSELLELAALKLQSLLPPVAEVYDDILDHCSFGPGTTTASEDYTQKSLFFKISGHQTMTSGCRPMLIDYAVRNPRWFQYHRDVQIESTIADRVSFVPKNFKTDRTITIQPSINIFLQKGIEWALVRVCRKAGITLASQTRNGELARLASLLSGHCTLDLKSASDSVSTELLRWLLPPDWFSLLMSVRPEYHICPVTKKPTPTAKFAGMGNATTFPIESLIFWALLQACRSTCGDNTEWRVYGDDIICHRQTALLLVELLSFAGFRTNVEKSFFFGSFFESCGYDFLAGLKVTPIYIRGGLTSVSAVYNLYNRLLQHDYFTFPLTLRYLQSLVLHPHRGPWHQARQELGWWREGFNPQLDAYFISDPPEEKRWDADTQSFVYSHTRLVLGYRRLTGVSKQILYSLKLLGERVDFDDSSIADLGQIVIRSQRAYVRDWPRLAAVLDAKQRHRQRGSLTWNSVADVTRLNRDAVLTVMDSVGFDQESLVV